MPHRNMLGFAERSGHFYPRTESVIFDDEAGHFFEEERYGGTVVATPYRGDAAEVGA